MRNSIGTAMLQRIGYRTLVALFAVSTACAGESDGSEWRGTVEERDGVRVVSNPAEPISPDPMFSLVLEQTYGAEEAPDDAIIGFLGGVAVDDSGNVYAIDRNDHALVAFDAQANVLWRAGREGQGPGEFERITELFWDGDQLLYLTNRNGTEVSIWDTSGVYRDSLRLTDWDIESGYVAGVLDDRRLVLWTFDREAFGIRLFVLDPTAEPSAIVRFRASAGPEDAGKETFAVSMSTTVAGDRIRVGGILQAEFQVFDMGGRLIERVRRAVPPFLEPITYLGTGRTMGGYFAPFTLEGGNLLAANYRVSNVESLEEFRQLADQAWAARDNSEFLEFTSGLDLYDSAGRLLSSLQSAGRFDDWGWPKTIGPDGRLYTAVYDPFPHVRRYRIEMNADP